MKVTNGWLAWLLTINYGSVMGYDVVGSSCAIMNAKMYIAGGQASTNSLSTQYTNMVTVDLTQSFEVKDFNLNNKELVSVADLPQAKTNVPTYGAIFGERTNGTKLWMFGGNDDTSGSNISYSLQSSGLKYFDLSTGDFSIPPIESPPSRTGFAWISHGGYFCMFGGKIKGKNTLSNEYWNFNINTTTWKTVVASPAVPSLIYHQGVYLKQRYFVVMGGQDSDNKVRDLSEIYIFDLQKNIWSVQKCSGGEDYPIVKFTPIVYKDKIIIQGGANMIDTTSPNYKLYSEMMILDTTQWSWRKIVLNTNTTSSTARAGYSAWLIGSQLVQFFGEMEGSDSNSTGLPANIAQVIDLDTNLVSDTYKPPPSTWYIQAFNGDYADSDGSSNLTAIIAGTVSGIIVLLLIIGGLIFWYRKKVNFLKDKIDEDFMEPVKPNLEPIWSDGENFGERPLSPNSQFQYTQSTGFSSSDPENINSQISGSTISNNNQGTREKQQSSASNQRPFSNVEGDKALFQLRTDTILPGEDYDEMINARFEK